MTATEAPGGPPALAERAFPPVAELAVACLILVVAGGIYLAASLPGHVALGPAVGLVATADALLVVNGAIVSRLRPFAWDTFFLVAGWALTAYVVIAGMLEFVFLRDHTSGGPLVVLSLMLVTFAVNIPLLLGFSVARYQDRPEESAAPAAGSGS